TNDAFGEDVDPLSLLGFEERKKTPNAPKAVDLAASSVLTEHYQAPEPLPLVPAPSLPTSSGLLIPDDYDPLNSSANAQPIPISSNPRSDVAPLAAPARISSQAPPASRRPVAPAAIAPTAPPGPSSRQENTRPDADAIAAALAAVLRGAGVHNAVVTPGLAN